MRVFFYGLFMDENILAGKGIRPSDIKPGFVEGRCLRIGERATLVPQAGNRAYGVLMTVSRTDATRLYADNSVADYVPQTVTVRLLDGTEAEAACYNLPVDKVTGTNPEYAEALLGIATRLGFPASYLAQIRQAREAIER